MPAPDRPCAPPDAPEDDLKELRLALVCYGGVSLAIYMHGITKEVHKLVRASRAFELDQTANPFAKTDSERAYWDALAAAARADEEGRRTRVAVDVISGTSAGGINGICLAKAIARDTSQDSLRTVWLKKGAILRLLDLRLGLPPLAGGRMFGWIHRAFEDMDAAATPGKTLMPSGLALDLFVTTTDAYGYNRRIAIEDPPEITTIVNKHVLRFQDRDAEGQLGAPDNLALALAARATSSFPGAFPPTTLGDVGDPQAAAAIAAEFFPEYALAGANALDTAFVDGGVLDNFPFRNAVRAIAGKPAAYEVDRKLLFVEPDMAKPEPPAPGGSPGFRRTLWRSAFTIPRRQPLGDALDEAAAYNRRVARVREMIDAASASITADVRARLAQAGGYRRLNTALNEEVRTSPVYGAYVHLKLPAVVERLAELVAHAGGYTRASDQAERVRASLLGWAEESGLLTPAPRRADARRHPLTRAQLDFLGTFDLDYGVRRLRFVIQRLNQLYGREGTPRRELDLAKRDLYELVCELITVFQRAAAKTGVGDLGDDDQGPDAVVTAMRDFLKTHLKGFGERAWDVLGNALPSDEAARDELRISYLGFPYWDLVTFPARAIGDVGELDEIEIIRVGPRDSVKLRPAPEKKLEGVKLWHFGAFFKRAWREQDYLWGRLDAAERLLWLLGQDTDPACRAAFLAILDDEQPSLRKARRLIKALRKQLQA